MGVYSLYIPSSRLARLATRVAYFLLASHDWAIVGYVLPSPRVAGRPRGVLSHASHHASVVRYILTWALMGLAQEATCVIERAEDGSEYDDGEKEPHVVCRGDDLATLEAAGIMNRLPIEHRQVAPLNCLPIEHRGERIYP
eukprot:2499414-Pyramimonas_sp.AAC.1